jgi:2-oxo-3-hexenedioate decarboxylase/2-keto-4-pentenoate hydratase
MSNVSDPATIAECRRSGALAHLSLHTLASRAEAEEFQAAAVKAFGGELCGHKIGATSNEVQRMLGCREPIHAPIRRADVLTSGATFRIPPGLLGIECEFGFQMGEDFPASAGASDMAALRSAIAECFVALEIVGRRVPADVPLAEVSAIADFSLNVAIVRGAALSDWQQHDLTAIPVRALVDGVQAAAGNAAVVLGHPLNALQWLAGALGKRGDRLRRGDIVLTGTCTGITKVAPGQVFSGCFADLPPTEVRLV